MVSQEPQATSQVEALKSSGEGPEDPKHGRVCSERFYGPSALCRLGRRGFNGSAFPTGDRAERRGTDGEPGQNTTPAPRRTWALAPPLYHYMPSRAAAPFVLKDLRAACRGTS